jgi:hypothetical protein
LAGSPLFIGVRQTPQQPAGVAISVSQEEDSPPLKKEKKTAMLKRFVIERDIPAVGKMTRPELKGAAETSNAALSKLAPRVQWEHSYVAGDKTFCIYLAEDEAAIHEHARLSGFPATKVTPVSSIIDPTTASA